MGKDIGVLAADPEEPQKRQSASHGNPVAEMRLRMIPPPRLLQGGKKANAGKNCG